MENKKEYRYTYRIGKSVSCYLFSMIWAHNRSDSVKIGFSVSKKVGNSVQRNRAKRRLRECITPFLPIIKKGSNLIFIARPEVLTVPFADMQKQMQNVIRKAGLFEDIK